MKRKVKALGSAAKAPSPANEGRPPWTFLTNHAHVLLCIAQDPAVRMRDVAVRVGVTERAVQRIVAELEEGGYVKRERTGRQNRYEICSSLPLRHPIERDCAVSSLIRMVLSATTKG